MTNILVVGAGYVGVTISICFAELGNTVVCIDKQKSKINSLSKGRLTIFDMRNIVDKQKALENGFKCYKIGMK
jgi:UDPglucose 6-dehydrogenase